MNLERQSTDSPYQNSAFRNTTNQGDRSNPLVSMLICNYNYGRFLGAAIESALAQTWQNTEIIVVDDGSTDESRDVLRKYEGRIRIILKDNGGQASAFNMGFAQAQGEIICFLDSDDTSHPDRVSRVVEKYRQGRWGLVCHDLELIDGDGKSLKTTYSQYTDLNMQEGDFSDVVVKKAYSYVFSPTSGLSIPKSLAQRIFPIPFHQWQISADAPLAFSAACLDPVGVISYPLGSYRMHGKNLFASSFYNDMYALRIASVTFKTRNYFICKPFRKGDTYDLKENYRYYRVCCLVARDKPYLYIPALLRKNIKYHFQEKNNFFVTFFNIVKFIAADLFIILQRILFKSSRHNLIKERFDRESKSIDKDQLRYILYDD